MFYSDTLCSSHIDFGTIVSILSYKSAFVHFNAFHESERC